MNYDQFVQKLLACVKERLLPSETVEKHELLKNNGVCAVGLSIRKKEETVVPVVYLEEYYECFQQGERVEDLAGHLLARSRMALPAPDWDYQQFYDFQAVKDRIAYKLVNGERNETLLKEVPHLAALDLAIVFYLMIPCKEADCCSILIKNSHLEQWKKGIPDLYQCARKNMPKLCPPVLRPLTEFIEELSGERLESCPMYVLTNENGIHGASALLYPGMPERIRTLMKRNYYLLPSSIHEFLIVPEDPAVCADNLNEMVKEVNATQIRKEELLSDHIYYFNGYNITKI